MSVNIDAVFQKFWSHSLFLTTFIQFINKSHCLYLENISRILPTLITSTAAPQSMPPPLDWTVASNRSSFSLPFPYYSPFSTPVIFLKCQSDQVTRLQWLPIRINDTVYKAITCPCDLSNLISDHSPLYIHHSPHLATGLSILLILFPPKNHLSVILSLLVFSFQVHWLLLYFPPWPCHASCRTLVPRPGIKPGTLAMEVRSPNHWTTREFPDFCS